MGLWISDLDLIYKGWPEDIEGCGSIERSPINSIGIYELVTSSVGVWNTIDSEGTFGKDDDGDNSGVRDKCASDSKENT